MDSVQHGPAKVQMSRTGETQFVECLCGSVGGLTGWHVAARGPDWVELQPSINMEGHFHTPNPTGRIPTGRMRFDP